MLYEPDGITPAKGAVVHIRKKSTLADTSQPGLSKKLADTSTVTTNDSGVFRIDTIDTGTYVIEGTSGNNLALIDSVRIIPDSIRTLPPDTLKPAGAIKGIIILSEGGDPRQVFVLAFGIDRFARVDTGGTFKFSNLARGLYDLRLISGLFNYGVMDTSGVRVIAGDTTNLGTISLPFTGIPTPKNLKVSYDTLKQFVILTWDKADTALVDGYNVYRAIKGQNFSLITQTPLSETTTTYYDSAVAVGNTYEYRVVSRKTSGEESPKVDILGDTVMAVSTSLVTTTITWSLNNTINDTASINDTIRVCVAYSNPTRIIEKIVWYVDSLNSTAVRQKSDSSLTGKDTLVYWWKQEGDKKVFVKVTDGTANVWADSIGVTIIQDIPVITFLPADNVVDYAGTVRCSVYVQQQFGTMTVEIDTATSGNYKSLGSLGLSGGKAYPFTTGNACSWDSVKVRIMDDDRNVVIKGFRVCIRPRPLTITSIDSTVNTITVHYSQSQDTDFTQYRIYRNTTNAVDTTSELWTTITANSTMSYTTPMPSYTWTPRYYRIYQKDTEGILSAGSNVMYGNIINSPPSVPVIVFPANDGDSIWADDIIRWSKSNDPNGNEVRYRVLVDYNNNGYTEFKTALADTFVKLTAFDSLFIKWKVSSYDVLGDSSAWSGERISGLKWPGRKGMRFLIGGPFWQITIPPFWMDTTEVTQSDYYSLLTGTYSGFSNDQNLPVNNVTWFDAALYCNARSKLIGIDTVYSFTSINGVVGSQCTGLENLQIDFAKNGYRLPTEAEWEYACKAGTSTVYFWGTDTSGISNYVWWHNNSSDNSHPVATKLPNSWGLYDMIGNLWEWCNDWAGNTGSPSYTEPNGPATGTDRVIRGGCWNGTFPYIDALTSTSRSTENPGTFMAEIGFRVIRRASSIK